MAAGRFAEPVSRADVEREFQFEIEAPRRSEARRRRVPRLHLSRGTLTGRSADRDRRRAAVVGERQVPEVGRERIVRTDQAKGVGRVVDRREEGG